MPKTKRQISRMAVYEYAAELGVRFPDKSDAEVIAAIDEFEDNDAGYTNPQSVAALIYLACYKGKSVESGNFFAKQMFGFDITS